MSENAWFTIWFLVAALPMGALAVWFIWMVTKDIRRMEDDRKK